MISLSDEVQNFSKLLYNPQLKEFVTIDQKFVGGGISMQSIIEENNFIVQQLKKMHAYFSNYCKLNEKVYQKIIEHELSVMNDKVKFAQIISSVDRNITSNIQIIKELSQRTSMENKKSLNLISTELSPLKKALDTKMSVEEYESRIIISLKAYDEGSLYEKQKIQTISQMQNGQNAGQKVNQCLTPTIKKKGKVSYDDFYEMTSKIDNKLKQIQQKQNILANQSQYNRTTLLRYIPFINNHDNDILGTIQQLHNVKVYLQSEHNSTAQRLANLQDHINQKINDDVWAEKFNQFQINKINALQITISRNREQIQKQLLRMSKQNELKLKKIVSEADGCQIKIINLDKALMINNSQIDHIKNQIKINFDEFEAEDKRLKDYIEEINNQIPKQIFIINKALQTQINNLKSNISHLSSNIQASILKSIDKKIGNRIKVIDGQLNVCKQKLSGLKKQFQALSQDSKITKQILSKKANFTDIIMNFDRKVDREDIKSLELMIQDNSQKISTLHYQESTSLNKIQRPESAKKPVSKSKPAKTLMGRGSKLDMVDHGTSLFMCGLEGPLSIEKKSYGQKILYSNHNRRKSLKSTGAVINDFTL